MRVFDMAAIRNLTTLQVILLVAALVKWDATPVVTTRVKTRVARRDYESMLLPKYGLKHRKLTRLPIKQTAAYALLQPEYEFTFAHHESDYDWCEEAKYNGTMRPEFNIQ